MVRGEFSHSITHNLPTYHRVMGSVKKDFVLRGANEKELHLEFLSHLLKPSVPPSDLGALRSFFMLGGSDERKILAVESLKA